MDRLAIDFGAAAVKVAVAPDGERSRLVRFGGAGEFPSAAHVEPDGSFSVGADVTESYLRSPRYLDRLKHRIQRADGSSPLERRIRLGSGTDVGLLDAVAAILRHAVDAAGVSSTAAVVLTHPVQWGDLERRFLSEALHRTLPGVSPTFVSEPEAVAWFARSVGLVARTDTVAVFDLGAGTFDAAVATGESPEPAREGHEGRPIGGDDVDAGLLDAVAAESDPGVRRQFERAVDESGSALALVARRTKEAVAVGGGPETFAYELASGSAVELEITGDLLDEITEKRCGECFDVFAGCLAALDRRSRLVLVASGGSVRLPAVAAWLQTQATQRGASLVTAGADGVGPGQAVVLGALEVAADRASRQAARDEKERQKRASHRRIADVNAIAARNSRIRNLGFSSMTARQKVVDLLPSGAKIEHVLRWNPEGTNYFAEDWGVLVLTTKDLVWSSMSGGSNGRLARSSIEDSFMKAPGLIAYGRIELTTSSGRRRYDYIDDAGLACFRRWLQRDRTSCNSCLR